MGGRALVQWEQNRDNAPDSLHVDLYAGGPAPAELEDVTFYQVPYVPSTQGVDERLDIIGRMPELRVLQLVSAGYEQVLDLVPDHVTLCNGRGLHDASTAEHTLALILAAQRELPRWAIDQRERRWTPSPQRSLADSRVMIVGYGSIGRAIERRLLPFETEVVRVAGRARPDEDVHGVDELHALLPEVDVVVLVTPLTEATRGLFGRREFSLLRDDALVVNVGRGPVLDTEALIAENGRIRAALDVTDPEPLPVEHPLWEAPGVYFTPHVAGGSAAFYPRARAFMDEQLARWAKGEALANVVRPGR
ncbi:2-hydroxyacid dehydrogenase [Nocardiopsis alba]|uniref:2-hydroxyacid dehydrogenase n=2 Tax=Nocardiopsis alba TaxID=53437 RepID=A0A7K2IW35_9ACTN|nr:MULTISPECIES: 2-hydroxyacid dehydrogenase [Nocardiopsis]AFR09111.1 D-isomer specific 2-hydroxyacid dehydrogenase, NAD binding domain protein [Nocardiopsis alba ATCC BAA-2165]MEC3894413.1 2-hydroxyacid dehydrogenase [Nocardiopsis sp. LDBS1602]MYR34182.1 dihydrofolate reductase [Nocardiopsis alba]